MTDQPEPTRPMMSLPVDLETLLAGIQQGIEAGLADIEAAYAARLAGLEGRMATLELLMKADCNGRQ